MEVIHIIALILKQLQNLSEKLHITEEDGQAANLDSASGQK